MKNFKIVIDNFLGFVKEYWKADFPSSGNAGEAGMMRNIDISSPFGVKPGVGQKRMTNSGDSGQVKTLIKSILSTPFQNGISYGCGGNKIYKLIDGEVVNDANWPYTVVGTGNVDLEDIKVFNVAGVVGAAFSLNESAKGLVGSLISGTVDPDWSSTYWVGSASMKTGVPHPLLVGGDKILYVADGNRIIAYDPSDQTVSEVLDLSIDVVINGMAWYNNRIYIVGNQPLLPGTNATTQGLWIFNTVSESYEQDVHKIAKGGALYVMGNTLYVFYQDITDSGIGKLGYFDGYTIRQVTEWEGGVPEYYQVTERQGALVWVSRVGSEDLIFCYANGALYQMTKGDFGRIGGIGLPFGKLLIASAQATTSFCITQEEGYSQDSEWKGLMNDITLGGRNGAIRQVKAVFDPIYSGAGAVIKLVDNYGSELWRGTVSYSEIGTRNQKIWHLCKKTQNVRPEIDYSNFNSTTTIVFFKSIEISGNNIA